MIDGELSEKETINEAKERERLLSNPKKCKVFPRISKFN